MTMEISVRLGAMSGNRLMEGPEIGQVMVGMGTELPVAEEYLCIEHDDKTMMVYRVLAVRKSVDGDSAEVFVRQTNARFFKVPAGGDDLEVLAG